MAFVAGMGNYFDLGGDFGIGRGGYCRIGVDDEGCVTEEMIRWEGVLGV